MAAGATLAPDAAAPLRASDVVLLSLTHYQAMYDLLAPATAELSGKTLINFSSDTPRAVTDASRWAAAQGATFVSGGIMINPPLVGSDASYVFYSGPQHIVEQQRPILEKLGRIDYRGGDPGLAMLWYQAQLDLFMTTLASTVHAASLLSTAGVRASESLPYALDLLAMMPHFVEGMDRELDDRTYDGADGAGRGDQPKMIKIDTGSATNPTDSPYVTVANSRRLGVAIGTPSRSIR